MDPTRKISKKTLDPSIFKPIAAFSGLDRIQLEKVATSAQIQRLDKDTLIYDENELATRFFMLLDGFARVMHITAKGDQVTFLYVPPAELFGIARVTGQTTYPARVTTASEAILFSWPMDLWDEFVTEFPEFLSTAQKTLGARLSQINARVIEVSTLGVEQRIATAILNLAQTIGYKAADVTKIDMPMTRQDLSELTATTTYTASRILSNWERLGIASCHKKRLSILNMKAIQAISNAEN